MSEFYEGARGADGETPQTEPLGGAPGPVVGRDSTTSLTFDVRITAWLTWCCVPRCGNCIRTKVGELVRPRCAEHATPIDSLRFLGDPLSQATQVIGYALYYRWGWKGLA